MLVWLVSFSLKKEILWQLVLLICGIFLIIQYKYHKRRTIVASCISRFLMPVGLTLLEPSIGTKKENLVWKQEEFVTHSKLLVLFEPYWIEFYLIRIVLSGVSWNYNKEFPFLGICMYICLHSSSLYSCTQTLGFCLTENVNFQFLQLKGPTIWISS